MKFVEILKASCNNVFYNYDVMTNKTKKKLMWRTSQEISD
jgi:hypothetical protein